MRIYSAFIISLCSFASILAWRNARPSGSISSYARRSQAITLTLKAAHLLPDWLKEQGWRADDSNVDFVLQGGTYVAIAKKGMKKGETLLSLPASLAYDVSKLPPWLKAETSLLRRLQTKELGMLALGLLAEREQGEASRLSPYLSQLPSLSPGVTEWSEVEKKSFQASTTHDAQKYFSALEQDLFFLEETLRERGTDLPLPRPDNNNFRRQFLWAMGTVKARVVIIEGVAMLLPGIDSMQADPVGGREVEMVGGGLFGGKTLRVLSDRPYSPQERVSLSYGVQSPGQQVLDRGALSPLPSPAFASCEIAVQLDPPSPEQAGDRFHDDKLSVLEREGLSPRQIFDLYGEKGEEIDPDLLRFLRLKLITGKDAFILESVFASTIFSTLSLPFSRANEMSVYTSLSDWMSRQIEKLEGFAEDADFHSLDMKDTKSVVLRHERYCFNVTAVTQELLALKVNLEIVRAQLSLLQSPADPNEYYQEKRLRELDLLRPLDDSEIVMD